MRVSFFHFLPFFLYCQKILLFNFERCCCRGVEPFCILTRNKIELYNFIHFFDIYLFLFLSMVHMLDAFRMCILKKSRENVVIYMCTQLEFLIFLACFFIFFQIFMATTIFFQIMKISIWAFIIYVLFFSYCLIFLQFLYDQWLLEQNHPIFKLSQTKGL